MIGWRKDWSLCMRQPRSPRFTSAVVPLISIGAMEEREAPLALLVDPVLHSAFAH